MSSTNLYTSSTSTSKIIYPVTIGPPPPGVTQTASTAVIVEYRTNAVDEKRTATRTYQPGETIWNNRDYFLGPGGGAAATAASSLPPSASSSSSSSSAGSTTAAAATPLLSTGAKIGLGLGVPAATLLIAALLGWMFVRQAKRIRGLETRCAEVERRVEKAVCWAQGGGGQAQCLTGAFVDGETAPGYVELGGGENGSRYWMK